jgi:predicted phage terminase large subunit-like protein
MKLTADQLPPSLLDDVIAERCKRSFRRFARYAVAELAPTQTTVWGWYLDAVCDHLDALWRGATGRPGGIRRLVVNLIHRSLKSTLSSVVLPAWCWVHDPWLKIMTAAYKDSLALRDSDDTRRLVMTPWYQRQIRGLDGKPTWDFDPTQNTKDRWVNTQRGTRIATHVTGGTGDGGRLLIVDDPLSIDEAYSEAAVVVANRWLEGTFFARQDDPAKSAIGIVQHRLRPDDPSGHAIEMGYEVLSLPLEYDPADRMRATSIGWTDPRTVPGESLCPERWTPEVIKEQKASLKELYEAIANQRPRNRTGAVLRDLTDLPRWQHLPDQAQSVDIISLDPSFKDLDPTKPKAKRSRVGLLVARLNGKKLYLHDHAAEYMDFERQKAEAKAALARHPQVRKFYVEDEANGPALITSFQAEVPGVIAVQPGGKLAGGGSKFERFVAVAHYLRAGNVLLPPDDHGPWVRPFVARILSYPSVEFDDDIDALTQLLRMEWLISDGDKTAATMSMYLKAAGMAVEGQR